MSAAASTLGSTALTVVPLRSAAMRTGTCSRERPRFFALPPRRRALRPSPRGAWNASFHDQNRSAPPPNRTPVGTPVLIQHPQRAAEAFTVSPFAKRTPRTKPAKPGGVPLSALSARHTARNRPLARAVRTTPSLAHRGNAFQAERELSLKCARPRARAYARKACVARERALNKPDCAARAGRQARPRARAYARPACVAPERALKSTGLRDAQAGKRDRAPELMRGQPAWRLNALIK